MTIAEALQTAVQHHQAGRLAEAEALYRQILAVEPEHADALHYLGVIAHQVGRNDAAIELIQRAIALRPNYPEAHSSLGNVLAANGRFDEAVAAHRQAIALRPDYAEAYSNLGGVLTDQDKLDEAIATCRQAIALRPNYPEAHYNLGIALAASGRLDEAIAACRQAIALRPNFPEAHNNLGNALKDDGRIEGAIDVYHQAIALRPDFPEAHCNLGVALMGVGRLDEAMAAYRQAIALRPSYLEAHSNLCLALHYVPGMPAVEIAWEHRLWNARHAEPLGELRQPHGNERDPERRLRIGYVSPDFREHSVSYFIEGLLAAHDRSRFEVFCYADLKREDAVSGRIRGCCGQWRRISGMSDSRVAELIRADGIDVLVDLAGHTAGNRLLVFARKPAPVQVTYLGYCDTTGMSAMDWRLTDAQADPPGMTEHLHSERLVRLPETFACFRPSDQAPAAGVLPAGQAGEVTFGCFNARAKVSDGVLALWARLLGEVPGSRLLLKNTGFGQPSVQGSVRAVLGRAGIAEERLTFMGHTPSVAGHLAGYSGVDIGLDTFPYCGTTTTCEALWMGVPVVTLEGRTHASRVGVSLLRNVGLPELVAQSGEEYVSIAAGIAADRARLAELRATLRERMKASPLMDAPRFAREIEAAYREMWREWCLGVKSEPAA